MIGYSVYDMDTSWSYYSENEDSAREQAEDYALMHPGHYIIMCLEQANDDGTEVDSETVWTSAESNGEKS